MTRKINDLSQKRFGKLIVLERAPRPIHLKDSGAYWKCKCDCGNEKIISGHSLVKGNTNSCSCLRKEKSSEAISHDTIEDVKKASAMVLYNNKYRNGDLIFEDFYILSQMNCYYCGELASNSLNNCNIFTQKSRDSSEFSKLYGNFVYNGLDRINSSFPHNLNNVIACCFICNRFKSQLNLIDFLNNILNLNTIPNTKIIKNTKSIKELKEIYPAKKSNGSNIFLIKVNSKRGGANAREIPFNLERNICISLILSDCAYCNRKINPELNYYSGIDRINNELGYIEGNCLPCCKFCNFAKSNLTLQEFQNWINKIKKYQEKTKSIENLIYNQELIIL